MKINGNDEIIKSAYPDKSQKQEQTRNTDFNDILKASVEQTAQNKPKVYASTLMKPISAIRFNPLSSEDKHIAVERADNLLNLLDDYRKQLADPRVTLRSIEPVMDTIAKEKEQLSSVLESLSEEDGLKDILNRTLITASLEIVKYHRGDYVAG
jgi:hypothetical protein